MADYKIVIDPTAEVHPSVILEGNITVGKYTKINAGTVIMGNVTIGDYTRIECNVAIRGTSKIGSWVHIYDLVNIEGGRPAKVGGSTAQVRDQSIIGDYCWINHGATMHGSQLEDGAVLDINACLDYNCHLGKDCLVCNGSALHFDSVVPASAMVEGVPGKVIKQNITDDDRRARMGLVPREWVVYAGKRQEEYIKAKMAKK